jgi:large subunit ribosomal protein L18e
MLKIIPWVVILLLVGSCASHKASIQPPPTETQAKAGKVSTIQKYRLLRKKAKENDAAIWRDVAERLSSSKRRRVAVNLSHLNRYTKDKETVIVPGKILGAGKLEHPLIVSAFAFSKQAQLKISNSKGKCLTIQKLKVCRRRFNETQSCFL